MHRPDAVPDVPTMEDVRSVSPALARYTQGPLLGDLWKRPGLSPRERSIVTVSVLIARHQSVEMPYHFKLALDNDVKRRELSEIITHLAFYSGWANATLAVVIAKDVFGKRGVKSDELPLIPYHLHRAMDNGLTRAQASEMLTQLAFYAGWPSVFTALPVVKDVLEKRPS